MKEMGIGRPRGREHTRQLALLLAFSCFGYLLYHTLAGGTLLAANGCDSYSLQAQNWLQGSLSIRDGEAYPWLELAIFEGRYYLSFPPLPTLFVLPFVWLGGGPAPANLLVALYALATLAAVYGCFCRLGHAPEVCAFWACAFTFATNLLEISRSGGVWYQAQALNLALCALAAERFAAKRRSACLLLFALAVGCHAWLFARSSKRAAGFTAAASAYLMVVGVMASLAFRVGVETQGRLWVLPLGACLFFLSDCILVVREYRREKSAVMTGAIWSTYLAAQLLLQLGLWLA